MKLQIHTINWEDDSETNFPANNPPTIDLLLSRAPHLSTEVLNVVRDKNRSVKWTSIVATILP